MPITARLTLVFILFYGIGVFAASPPLHSAAGFEIGGNGSMLLTDATDGAFGVGAGMQGSVYMTLWRDRPIAMKIRFESISMNQEAVQKADASYLVPGYSLKSTSEAWDALSVGAEGGFGTHGQIFFWEALLGYGIGQPSNVALTPAAPDQPLVNTSQATSNGFVVSGGVGIKRSFSPRITGLMSVRSFFLLNSTYGAGPLNGRTFIPVPILFNVGAEFPFDF